MLLTLTGDVKDARYQPSGTTIAPPSSAMNDVAGIDQDLAATDGKVEVSGKEVQMPRPARGHSG